MAKPKKVEKVELVKELWLEVKEDTSIRIEVSEFKGVHRFDIREHVETPKYTGFTKKGINLPTEYLRGIYEALGQILNTVEEEGLYNPEEEEVEEA